MPKCRNCQRDISRFDTDICPYCGAQKPIDRNYKTHDVTTFVDPMAKDYKLYKSKSKRLAVFLSATLGMFGVHDFYLGRPGLAYLNLVITTILIAGGGSLIFFLVPALHSFWAYLIPVGALILFHLLHGLSFLFRDSLKDGNGEFLR